MRDQEIYSRRNHSKYNIKYHLIFSTKYRRKCLTPDITKIIKKSFLDAQLASCRKWEILEVEVDKEKLDHIHLLINSSPVIAPYEIIHDLKQRSTYNVWHSEYFSTMKKFYWKRHHLWTRGYFCCSIGNCSEETIRKYIETQG